MSNFSLRLDKRELYRKVKEKEELRDERLGYCLRVILEVKIGTKRTK